MDLKQLQLVVELAEAGSFSKLCAQRGIVLSALSKQLASLETEFSAKLFHRTGRGLVLNEFGQSLLPRIQSLLNEAQLLKDEVACSAEGPRGRVRLAIQASLTQTLVGELFGRARRDHPLVDIRLMEGLCGSIEDAVASGRADLGVLARHDGPAAPPDEVLRTERLHFVSRAGDPLGASPWFDFRRLAGLPLVLLRSPDALRPALEDAARRSGIALHVDIEVDSLTAMKEIVAEGAGYTVLSRHAVATELQAGRLQASPLVDPGPVLALALAVSPHRPLTAAGRVVAGLLRDIVKGAAGADR